MPSQTVQSVSEKAMCFRKLQVPKTRVILILKFIRPRAITPC